MSSMRSASSSTTYSTWLSTQFLASMWSSSRPGVAISTSTPAFSSAVCGFMSMPPNTTVDAQLGVLGVGLDVLGDLVGQLARRRQHQRAHRVARRRHARVLVLEHALQQRQREGGGLAGAGLGGAHHVAAGQHDRESPWPGSASWTRSRNRRRHAAVWDRARGCRNAQGRGPRRRRCRFGSSVMNRHYPLRLPVSALRPPPDRANLSAARSASRACGSGRCCRRARRRKRRTANRKTGQHRRAVPPQQARDDGQQHSTHRYGAVIELRLVSTAASLLPTAQRISRR